MLALTLLTGLVLYWRWVGYQGTDDIYYVWSAMEWAGAGPGLGDSHWSLRYALILPMAAAIATLGRHPVVLALPNLLTYVGFLVVTYLGMRHWFGWRSAGIAVLLCVVLPIFPVQATYPNPDLIEAAFVAISFWCFLFARERGGSLGWLFLSGVLVGVAFLAREISVVLLMTYSILFLVRPGIARWRYFIMAAGFVLVAGGQMAYFAARTGNPLYRVQISTGTHIAAVDRADLNDRARTEDRVLDAEGALVTQPWLKPVATTFVSQKFGLLFFLAIFAVWRLGRSPTLSPRQRSVVLTSALLALVSWAFVALNTDTLLLIPRYFMITAAAAVIPTVALLGWWWSTGRRAHAVIAGAALVSTSVMLLYLEYTEPTRAEQEIVQIVRDAGEPVYLDAQTEVRARVLLAFADLGNRVSTGRPPPGALVVRRVGTVEACKAYIYCGWRTRVDDYLVQPNWVVLRQDAPRRRLAGSLLRAIGLERVIPPDLLVKIERPYAGLAIYRVQATP